MSGSGFLFGLAFGAGDGVREMAGLQDAEARPGERLRWLHLDWRAAEARDWLAANSGTDPVAAEAALDEAVRPRSAHFGDVLLLVLRAANLEEDAERHDLVSLRLLAAPGLLVSLRRNRVRSAEDVRREAVAKPSAFKDPADLMLALVGCVQDRLQALLEELADRLDDYEDGIAAPEESPERYEIAELRRGYIAMRKSMLPQRDALARLAAEPHPLIGKKQERLLREEAQRAARLLDDLDAARERTVVLMEELAVQSTEQLNRRIYLFTVIAGIFLPLTFVAGALGMNVGGIPFAEHPQGFAAVMGLLGLAGVGIWLLLRRKRWV